MELRETMILRLIAAGLGLLIACGTAAAQGSDSFYIRNSGSATLEGLRVSPDYSTRWGDEQLGSTVLEPGEEIEVHVDGMAENCFFDVQVDDADGNSREFWGVNLCSDRFIDVQRSNPMVPSAAQATTETPRPW